MSWAAQRALRELSLQHELLRDRVEADMPAAREVHLNSPSVWKRMRALKRYYGDAAEMPKQRSL